MESMAAGTEEEGEVAVLREALRQQAQTVEELRAELDAERRASSSGADEALAMILRLQAEKAAERMEAEQFRRVAEERIQHDEDTLAFLKAVVFHQEMEISSLNRRLLAVHAGDRDPFSPAAVDLPWLRKLAGKNGVQSRRNASHPSASLEELCSELDSAAVDADVCKGRRPARTVSDIGEVIGSDKDWARFSQSPPPLPRLHRSASHRLRRAPSCSAQCGMGSARASPSPPPEIIAEEGEKACKISNAALEADIEQIKATVQSLQTEFTKLRESTVSTSNAQSRLLTEIHSKLERAMPQPQQQQQTVQGGHGSSPAKGKAIREEGSSSSKVPQGELLMNHFIEVCGLAISALLVRPLLKVAASMSLPRCFLILALAVAIRTVLINSYARAKVS